MKVSKQFIVEKVTASLKKDQIFQSANPQDVSTWSK